MHDAAADRQVGAGDLHAVAVISNLPGDRKAWLVAMLDLPATDPARYRWERVAPADPEAMSPTRRLLHVLDERTRWRNAVAEALRRAG